PRLRLLVALAAQRLFGVERHARAVTAGVRAGLVRVGAGGQRIIGLGRQRVAGLARHFAKLFMIGVRIFRLGPCQRRKQYQNEIFHCFGPWHFTQPKPVTLNACLPSWQVPQSAIFDAVRSGDCAGWRWQPSQELRWFWSWRKRALTDHAPRALPA